MAQSDFESLLNEAKLKKFPVVFKMCADEIKGGTVTSFKFGPHWFKV